MSSSHPYKLGPSPIFGEIARPLLDFEIESEVTGEWVTVEDALADTGADASLLPVHIGRLVSADLRPGPRFTVHGVVPGADLVVHLRTLNFRIGRRKFAAPTLIADSPDVPAILGRHGALDRWRVTYARGRTLRIRK